MQHVQSIGEAPKLCNDVLNERNRKVRFSIGLPKFSQVSTVRPSEHEVAFPSGDSCNKFDNIWMVDFVGVDMSLDLSFPLCFQFPLLLFVISEDLLDLFNSNVGPFAVKLAKI